MLRIVRSNLLSQVSVQIPARPVKASHRIQRVCPGGSSVLVVSPKRFEPGYSSTGMPVNSAQIDAKLNEYLKQLNTLTSTIYHNPEGSSLASLACLILQLDIEERNFNFFLPQPWSQSIRGAKALLQEKLANINGNSSNEFLQAIQSREGLSCDMRDFLVTLGVEASEIVRFQICGGYW